MESIAGLVIWGIVLVLIVRAILKAKAKGNRAHSAADSLSSSKADVGGIQFHFHFGDGHHVGMGANDHHGSDHYNDGSDDDHYYFDSPDQLRQSAIGNGIRNLPDSARHGAPKGGNPMDSGNRVVRSRRARFVENVQVEGDESA